MAEPISFKPTPAKTAPDAHDELQQLLQTLHEQGLLRIANGLAAGQGPIGKILADGLNSAGARNAVQNLGLLLMALGRIEPDAFYKLVFSLTDGARELTRTDRDRQSAAPGLRGAYKALNDDELWANIAPLVDAFKAVTAGLQRSVDKPISDIAGKPSRS